MTEELVVRIVGLVVSILGLAVTIRPSLPYIGKTLKGDISRDKTKILRSVRRRRSAVASPITAAASLEAPMPIVAIVGEAPPNTWQESYERLRQRIEQLNKRITEDSASTRGEIEDVRREIEKLSGGLDELSESIRNEGVEQAVLDARGFIPGAVGIFLSEWAPEISGLPWLPLRAIITIGFSALAIYIGVNSWRSQHP